MLSCTLLIFKDTITDMSKPMRKPLYGILLRVMLYTRTVIPFARIAILQYFENGIQLLTCCIFIV